MKRIAIVGGAGHVGLPLGIVLADQGFHVTAYDISSIAVQKINNGVFPFMEEGGERLLRKVLKENSFTATTERDSLKEAEVAIIVIGTPVDEHLGPNPNSVVSEVMSLVSILENTRLLILRSTIFPGVSEKLVSQLKLVRPDLEIAYCPERIVEGQAIKEIRNLPQIIGCDSEIAFKQANEIFEQLGIRTIRSTFAEAELAKLFTNVWRYMKFATANQFWMMANSFGVDYEKVREAITFEYPRAADLPKAGFAAGPCLFKDTMQLSALVQQNFPLGHSAMMINEGTPGYLVDRMKHKYDLKNLTVGILGMAFKADVDDTRSSLAYKLRKLLIFECAEVLCSDPFVKDERLVSQEEVLKRSDLLVIGSPHTVYKNIVFSKPVIDIWALLDKGVLI